MVKLQGTTITMTRGDTARVQIGITDVDGSEYKPLNGDKVRFAAKKSYYDEQPVILKEIPISTLLLTLEPEDTKPLQFGKYVYDIELTQRDGTVNTFITKASLILEEEVH